MKLDQIHHVAIIASNYEASRAFYVDKLGLSVVREVYREERNDHILTLLVGDTEIELFGMDGLTLAKEVKKLNPQVNIIFLTVCDEKEHAQEVLKIKPSGYILKPAKKDQLEFELFNLRYSLLAM